MLDRNFLDRWNSVLMDLEGAENGFYLKTYLALDELGVPENVQGKIGETILSVLEKSPIPFPLVSYQPSMYEGCLCYIAIDGASIDEHVLADHAYSDEIMALEDEDQAREFFTQLIGVVSAMWFAMKEVETRVLELYLEK